MRISHAGSSQRNGVSLFENNDPHGETGRHSLAGAGQEEKQPAPLVCCTFLHCLKAYAVWSAVCVSVYLYDICQFFSGLYGCPLPWGRKETVRLHLLVTIT